MSMFDCKQEPTMDGVTGLGRILAGGWQIGFHVARWLRLISLVVVALFGFHASLGLAQQALITQGDYVGTLGSLSLKLHITIAPDGTLSGKLDSPSQGAMGIPCTDFLVEGQTLSFKVPAIAGSWKGSIEDNAATLSGSWTQGASSPLVFTRDTFIAADQPSPVDGFWLGTLQGPNQTLRIQLVVRSDQAGKQYCTGDSLDQGAFNLSCTNVTFSGDEFSFDVPAVNGHWSGKLSVDRNALTGILNQGVPLSLDFARQAQRQVAPQRPPISYSPAMAPVDANGIKSVLDRDLEQALKSGALAPEMSGGVVIGVIHRGARRVFSYGTAKTDSIFEIGSITKTFTGSLLAQMVQQGEVKLDTPIRELLPAGTVDKPQGVEISLLDLVSQHSGLPRMPDNFKPTDQSNPYADYRAAELYQFIGKYGVSKPADATFLYSNVGLGLLGQALANHAGTTYAELLKQKITEPLGMKDTVVTLSPQQQSRFIQGYAGNRQPAHAWDLDAFAGAGAIRSTAADMLTYLEAQLHPERINSSIAKNSNARTLPAAIMQSHELQADASSNIRIAFAWLYNSVTGDYWHNGATGGYSSYAFFNPQQDYAAIVLFNTTVGAQGSFADSLGQHVSQRFAGQPAVSLASP